MAAADAATAARPVHQLRTSHGTVATFDGVSFAVRAGECDAGPGPGGAGKTSLLRCWLGLAGTPSARFVWPLCLIAGYFIAVGLSPHPLARSSGPENTP